MRDQTGLAIKTTRSARDGVERNDLCSKGGNNVFDTVRRRRDGTQWCGMTEIVGHAHVYKDRPGVAFLHFEDQPHSTARVDVERNEQGRFSVTCHQPVAVANDLVPAGLSDNWDKRGDNPVACLVITNHCPQEIYFLTIGGLEERVLCGQTFRYLFFDGRTRQPKSV